MNRFTHWLFQLSLLPRLLTLLLLFGLLGGGLFYSLRTGAPAPVNVVVESDCDPGVASVDPSSSCSDPTTYHDFRYVCNNGSEGYLGADEPNCLTLESATSKIVEFCRTACMKR